MHVRRLSVSLELPRWLPARAHIEVLSESVSGIVAEARMGSRPLARLMWSHEGELGYIKQLDPEGNGHGLELDRSAGHMVWCAQWVHGKQHGLAISFDGTGRPLLATRFVQGRGTDLWMSCGNISEVREMADAQPHGWVRWGDPQQPSEEEHYRHGERHGIVRRWEEGTLCAGFPQFYVEGVEVSRRKYQAAQARDPSLPRYDRAEDSSRRPMPAVVAEAIARARRLPRDHALLAHARRVSAVRKDYASAPRRSTSRAR